MIELRPYQRECIESIESAEKKGTNRQLVALPLNAVVQPLSPLERVKP
jgi:superfamily II DNA or RNA helicase